MAALRAEMVVTVALRDGTASEAMRGGTAAGRSSASGGGSHARSTRILCTYCT
jgi:hypothetical protein